MVDCDSQDTPLGYESLQPFEVPLTNIRAQLFTAKELMDMANKPNHKYFGKTANADSRQHQNKATVDVYRRLDRIFMLLYAPRKGDFSHVETDGGPSLAVCQTRPSLV